MKITLVLLSILLVGGTYKTNSDKGYIRLLYSGDQSKPYPRLLLYIPGSVNLPTDSISTDRFEITREDFDVIKASIESKRIITSDSALRDGSLYQFNVYDNGESTIFLTPYLDRSRKIFSVIRSRFSNKGQAKIMNELLESIRIRSMIENKLM